MTMEIEKKDNTIYRPRQVLLVGLGGVGSRVVDRIMGMVPKKYMPYTQAISIDTDITEIGKLRNIPLANRIKLGEGITIGSYTSNHPEIKDWMVEGEQMDLVRSRNTSNGAKQIRMVSRVALRATNTEGNLGNRIINIVDQAKKSDGKLAGSGLLVMVVCSVAGGTGAGTVLQVPIYLEQAIKSSYDKDSVEFECAMLMPNAFKNVLSEKNYFQSKVNAYAVLRELMSLNTGRLRRFEFFDTDEVDKSDERCAPYGRVFLFDDKNSVGESIPGDVEHTHVPLTADALYEYLFGPGHGKISSALDNTLAQVYASNGADIFGSVGRAALEFPRTLYKLYCQCRWIDATLSDTWLMPDEYAKERYRAEAKKALVRGDKKPNEDMKYRLYNEYIDSEDDNITTFRAEIQRQVRPCPYSADAKAQPFDEINPNEVDNGQTYSVGNWFFERICDSFYKRFLDGNNTINDTIHSRCMTGNKFNKKNASSVIDGFSGLYMLYEELKSKIPAFAKAATHPDEARKDMFFDAKKGGNCIYYYMRDKRFHPIAIRYFLYDLYNVLLPYESSNADIANPAKNDNTAAWKDVFSGSKETRNRRLGDKANKVDASARGAYKVLLAQALLPEVKELIQETEDLFFDIIKVKEFFSTASENTLKTIAEKDKAPDTVLAGSTLSAHNCWKLLESEIHNGEEGEDEVIDDEMSAELCRLIYVNYVKHTERDNSTSVTKNGQIIRVRTQYFAVLRSKLQEHFMNQLNFKFGHLFPMNVIESVQEDCRVHNCWMVSKKENPYLEIENFICKDIVDDRYAQLARQEDLEPLDAAEELKKLLAKALGKSSPRCGLVEQAADDNYNNYLMVLNENILPIENENDEETGEIIVNHDRTKLMAGVETNNILGIGVNPYFEGDSLDKIVMVTVYSGVSPNAFVGFHAPDDDRDDPTDGKDYYRAYRKYINKMVNNPSLITPHIHKNWHISGMLADISTEHTNSVQRNAARAFVYGFIFDLIVVTKNGTVEYGDGNSAEFKSLDESGIIEKLYLTPSEQAELSSGLLSQSVIKDKLNAILYSIYEELCTNVDLRAAIIKKAEEQLDEDKRLSEKSFIINAAKAEPIASSLSYKCILDVLDGYYQGSMRLDHYDVKLAVNTTQYMFNVLLQGIYDQVCNVCSSDSPNIVKKVYIKVIEALYSNAVCDDIDKPKKTDGDEIDWFDSDNLTIEEIMDNASKTNKVVDTKPFSEGGRFGIDKAKKAVVYMLDATN